MYSGDFLRRTKEVLALKVIAVIYLINFLLTVTLPVVDFILSIFTDIEITHLWEIQALIFICLNLSILIVYIVMTCISVIGM